jgi:hypothetical protein
MKASECRQDSTSAEKLEQNGMNSVSGITGIALDCCSRCELQDGGSKQFHVGTPIFSQLIFSVCFANIVCDVMMTCPG